MGVFASEWVGERRAGGEQVNQRMGEREECFHTYHKGVSGWLTASRSVGG